MLSCRPRAAGCNTGRMNTQVDLSQPVEIRWAPRVLVLALFGIFSLTLYPFRFSAHAHFTGRSPLFLQTFFKGAGTLDSFLNVLLFVPFGFGLAALIFKKTKSRIAAALIPYAAGALVSYTVELLQFYIPERDSGWQDIVTNSGGALVGAIVFIVVGRLLLVAVRHAEAALERLTTPRRAAILLTLYLIPWLVVSAHWERRDNLHSWDGTSLLGVGATGGIWNVPWQGRVYSLALWDTALSSRVASRITSLAANQAPFPQPVSLYRFSGPPPFQDQFHSSPALDWQPPGVPVRDNEQAFWDGGSWALTHAPVASLEQNIQTTGRFSIYLRCAPSSTGVGARIISLGKPDQPSDLEIRQDFTDLSIWFRSRFSFYPDDLQWSVPNVFTANQVRDILITYDGAALNLYLDGRRIESDYHLGPWTSLAWRFIRLKTGQLKAYRYAFFAFMFFPVGGVVAFAWRKVRGVGPRLVLVALAVVLPPLLLELVLIASSNPAFSFDNVVMALVLLCFGWLWMNMEGDTPPIRKSP
jgi:hypothetical protein